MSKKLFILPIVSFFMQKGDNSMFFFFFSLEKWKEFFFLYHFSLSQRNFITLELFLEEKKKKKARRLTLHKPKNKFPWKNTKVLLGKCSLYR